MDAKDFDNEADSIVTDSYELIDRKKQINQFNTFFDKLSRRKPVSSPIIQWHGGPGIGKSSLIELLVDECQRREISFSLINFKMLGDLQLYYNDPTLLIEKIIFDGWKVGEEDAKLLKDAIEKFRQALKPKDQLFVITYDKYPQQKISIVPRWLEELEGVRIEFEALAKRLAGLDDSAKDKQIKPLVIFFDETESVNRELVYWIEDYIFRPLSLLLVSLVVWTGRKPWQWRRPEVRQRVYSEKLDVFNGADVETQLETQLVSDEEGEDLAKQLFMNVYGVTGGHPFANRVVINQINSWTEKDVSVTAESLSQNQSGLFDLIFEKFIEEYAFKDLLEDQRTACKLLGMVRRFDVKMLQEIAMVSGLSVFEKMGREDFRDLLNELKKAQFMDWNQGFVIDQSLRHLISEYYFWRQKDEYVTINQVALKVNEEWLKTPVDNRGLFVIEVLYHNACLKRTGKIINLRMVLLEYLGVFPIENRDALKDSLIRLAGELRRDEELASLFNDLEGRKLLDGEEQLSNLIDVVENFSPT